MVGHEIMGRTGLNFRSNLKSPLWGLCLLLAFGLQPSGSRAQSVSEELAYPALKAAQALSKTGKTNATVADFTDLDGNVTQLGRYLAEEFLSPSPSRDRNSACWIAPIGNGSWRSTG